MATQDNNEIIPESLDLNPYWGLSREEYVRVATPQSSSLTSLESTDNLPELEEEFIRVENPPSPASIETEYLETTALSTPTSGRNTEYFEHSPSSSDEYWSIHSDQFADLEHAALEGNWKSAERVLRSDETLATAVLVRAYSMTALHIAALKGYSEFVKKMVDFIPEKALEVRDGRNHTALDYIALTGNEEAAKALINKNSNLPNLLNDVGWGALHFAVFSGSLSGRSTDFIRYLAKKTTNEEILSADLVENLVVKGYLDVLLDLLNRFPSYLDNISNAATLLYFLSSTPSNFSSSNRFGPLQRFIYSYFIPVQSSYESGYSLRSNTEVPQERWPISVLKRAYYQAVHWLRQLLYNIFRRAIPSSCIRRHQDAKHRHNCAVILVSRVWNIILEKDAIRECFTGKPEILYKAIEFGILEISRICFQRRPQLIWLRLRKGKDFLEEAIRFRRDKVFNFLMEDKTCFLEEFYGLASNSILHEVAKLTPFPIRSSVPGAALQMQREMQWFKAVEKLMPPNLLNKKDNDQLTARELFSMEHKELAEAGEEWMKARSNSCMIVSTLITTVVFAAAFNVPGGKDPNNGVPIFLGSNMFLVFAVSDALALFSSLTSLLMFLSILTARYAQEDFLKSLPKRLIIGLASLFFAIATMIIAFGAALFIVLSNRLHWVLIPIVLLAAFPVSIFALLQLRLFIQIIETTYWSNLLLSV